MKRAPQGARIPKFVEFEAPLHAEPPEITHASRLRMEFASLVIRRLANVASAARLAVINEGGRPAIVNCSERLFDLVAQDHPIVGVYTQLARIRDVMDDLKAAGL